MTDGHQSVKDFMVTADAVMRDRKALRQRVSTIKDITPPTNRKWPDSTPWLKNNPNSD